MQGAAYRGYSASKRRYFYGFKVPLLMPHDGLPGECYLHAGSEADITGLKALRPQLPAGSVLYADAAYTDYEGKTPGARRNKLRCCPTAQPTASGLWQAFLIQHFRKGVETTISQSPEPFPKSIHAATAQGFALKILLFVFTHTPAQLGA